MQQLTYNESKMFVAECVCTHLCVDVSDVWYGGGEVVSLEGGRQTGKVEEGVENLRR